MPCGARATAASRRGGERGSAHHVASACGRRRARLPGALGGGRRPARRRHRPPAPDPARRRRPAAALPLPAVRRDDLLPVLLALPRRSPTATSSGSPTSTTSTGSRCRHRRRRDHRRRPLRADRRRRGRGRVQHRGRPPGPRARLGLPRAHRGGGARARHLAASSPTCCPQNRKMLRVFSDAGYVVDQEFDDGVVRLSFDLEPTEDSLGRHLRPGAPRRGAVGRSGCCSPESVAVVGAEPATARRRPRRAAAPRSTPASPARSMP